MVFRRDWRGALVASRLVLFFGEDVNDANALMHLAKALAPAGVEIEMKYLRRPPILRRDSGNRKRRGMASEIAGFAEILGKRRHVIVVVHRDCDQLEPAHVADSEDLYNDLVGAGVPNPVPATPAWEMETWWMLFPEALALTRKCWNKIDYGSVSVGMIANAKERLRRDLRPKNVRCRDYCESDSGTIASFIAQHSLADEKTCSRSESLREFRQRFQNALS